MQKIIPAILLLMVYSTLSFAQCDKNLVLHSSKTNYLDKDTVLQRTVEENTIIEINRPDMTISPADHKMTGKITSETCDWNTPFTQGKMILRAVFTDGQGSEKNVVITIEGKNGKVSLLLQTEGGDHLIRVDIDKFEEKK